MYKNIIFYILGNIILRKYIKRAEYIRSKFMNNVVFM